MNICIRSKTPFKMYDGSNAVWKCMNTAQIVSNAYFTIFMTECIHYPYMVVTKKVATCTRFALPARLVWLRIKIWRFTLFSREYKVSSISRLYCTKYVQELILDWLWAALMKSYEGRRRVSGDKDSISEPSAAYWPLLQLTYSYSCSHWCQNSGLLLTISLRIRLFDLAATTEFICT